MVYKSNSRIVYHEGSAYVVTTEMINEGYMYHDNGMYYQFDKSNSLINEMNMVLNDFNVLDYFSEADDTAADNKDKTKLFERIKKFFNFIRTKIKEIFDRVIDAISNVIDKLRTKVKKFIYKKKNKDQFKKDTQHGNTYSGNANPETIEKIRDVAQNGDKREYKKSTVSAGGAVTVKLLPEDIFNKTLSINVEDYLQDVYAAIDLLESNPTKASEILDKAINEPISDDSKEEFSNMAKDAKFDGDEKAYNEINKFLNKCTKVIARLKKQKNNIDNKMKVIMSNVQKKFNQNVLEAKHFNMVSNKISKITTTINKELSYLISIFQFQSLELDKALSKFSHQYT